MYWKVIELSYPHPSLNNEEAVGERVCKKCGVPLRSTNRYNYCDNCRRERTKARRETMELCLGVDAMVLSILLGVKHFVNDK